MRAILIDPFARKVSEIDIDPTLDNLYETLKVDLITVVNLGANHALILDDEGLLKDKTSQEYFWLGNSVQPFAGRGLILANELGENRAATLPLALVEEKVKWVNKDEINPDDYTGWTIHVM